MDGITHILFGASPRSLVNVGSGRAPTSEAACGELVEPFDVPSPAPYFSLCEKWSNGQLKIENRERHCGLLLDCLLLKKE
jgi:hypothetical protein